MIRPVVRQASTLSIGCGIEQSDLQNENWVGFRRAIARRAEGVCQNLVPCFSHQFLLLVVRKMSLLQLGTVFIVVLWRECQVFNLRLALNGRRTCSYRLSYTFLLKHYALDVAKHWSLLYIYIYIYTVIPPLLNIVRGQVSYSISGNIQ